VRLLLALTASAAESPQYLQARRGIENGSGSHRSALWLRPIPFERVWPFLRPLHWHGTT
jgi:hypothetical protein